MRLLLYILLMLYAVGLIFGCSILKNTARMHTIGPFWLALNIVLCPFIFYAGLIYYIRHSHLLEGEVDDGE